MSTACTCADAAIDSYSLSSFDCSTSSFRSLCFAPVMGHCCNTGVDLSSRLGRRSDVCSNYIDNTERETQRETERETES